MRVRGRKREIYRYKYIKSHINFFKKYIIKQNGDYRSILAFPQDYLRKMQSSIYRNVLSSSNPLNINNGYKLIDLIWNKLSGNFIGIMKSTLMLIVRNGCYNLRRASLRLIRNISKAAKPILSHRIKVMANKEHT